jgi:hypothetical protein
MAVSGAWPMKEQSLTDALVRQFLLGKLADEKHAQIEALFLTDSQVSERVLAIEQELIEDYFEDSLSEEDKERFLSRYAQTEEQRRKLRITKSIKDWAVAESKAPQAIAATLSIWSRLRTRLRLKPLLFVPIAVTTVIAIVLGFVLLNRHMEQRRHLAVEQELVQLNSPTNLRGVPPQMASYDLRPVTPRTVEPERELKPGADIRIVELRLPWIQKERYSTYRVQVSRADDEKVFTIPNVAAETDGTHVIRIRLPVHMLRRGYYQIRLSGIADDKSPGLTQEYNFAVRG